MEKMKVKDESRVHLHPINMTSSQIRTERQLDVLLAQPGNSKPHSLLSTSILI